MSSEKYLRPEVINQVARLDLRARFIIEGFLSGLHASPFHGFSVEFSEHRKYVPGDDVKDIDWNAYAKTDRYYIRKYQAETNMTGYLAIDLSASMDWPKGSSMTKFDYAICLAAALAYLMIHQQDPVGLVAFDTELKAVLPPRSKRTQLGSMLAVLSTLKPTGETDVAGCLIRMASLMRGKSLIMVFSDLLTDPEPVLQSLFNLRHRGHEVILFHILDKAEVRFPFEGMTEFEDVEDHDKLVIDATGYRPDYLEELQRFREKYRVDCARAGIDFVPVDTGVNFDKALLEYLLQRQRRF